MAETKKMLVDASTGEVDDVVLVAVPKRSNGFTEGWVAMSQNALKQIAEIDRLEDMRVLMMLLSILDFENYILVQQKALANALDMDKAQVSRAVRRLTERGILIKGPKAGRSWTYRLNPTYGWKGSAHGHRKALQKATEKWGQAKAIENDAEVRRKLEEMGQTRLTD